MGSDSIQARGVFSLPESKALSFLVMVRVALSQTDPVPNLGVILELWLLFEEQVTVVQGWVQAGTSAGSLMCAPHVCA